MAKKRKTATVHLIQGPAGSEKTARLLDRCREISSSESVLWIGPTRRYVEAMRSRFPSEAPLLLTFQQFADELVRSNCPGSQPLATVQSRLLVDAILTDMHGRAQVRHFGRVAETRGFGTSLFALLKELKHQGIAPSLLARAAYRREVETSEQTRVRRAIGVKDREIIRLYARYQEVLQNYRLFDVEERIGQARDLLQQGQSRPFDKVKTVFVDGFSDFTAPQQEILESLAEEGKELWLTLPDDGSDDRAELFTRPRHWTVHWTEKGGKGLRTSSQRSLFDDEPLTQQPPAGLAHLERQLFRPPRKVEPSTDAAGLLLLEAPGQLGEARMVAREIKTLLLEGTPRAEATDQVLVATGFQPVDAEPTDRLEACRHEQDLCCSCTAEDIIVAVRELAPNAHLLQEVFTEYGIPVDIEGTEPLTRRAVVGILLRAARIPDEDWSFAPVTALLRSGYFRPDWPETRADPEVARHAEVLLRLIGEPRHRDAYRQAVHRWAVDPPPGLEDEQAEESRRDRTHHLAVRCQAFLDRFFRTWDGFPGRAPLEQHLKWLHQLAEELGIVRVAEGDPADAMAWQRFEQETRHWMRLDQLVHVPPRPLTRKEFLRRLAVLAAETGLARTPRGPGRVRILSAEIARTLEVPFLFVMGLGEGSFPRLTVPSSLLDEADRLALRQAGLPIAASSERMPDEMLLFYQLVTRATKRLTLSYPAVDDRGQPLLPSSFLTQVLECFEPGAVAVQSRRMLLEGFESDIAMSPAEYRVRLTRSGQRTSRRSVLEPDTRANLRDAEEMAQGRYREPDFTRFEGLFHDLAVIAAVGQLFNPEKVFSPTALEDYVACPFKFFLKHVLKLDELSEPREEIEVTRRGQAFHRALARLHNGLHARDIHEPLELLDQEIHRQLTDAVAEYAARAASPASRVLWQLEGQRLTRAGAKYRGHWLKFLEPWKTVRVGPRPHLFEVDFGLPGPNGQPPTEPLIIRHEGVEVRVSGRIDRVDVVELDDGIGFWVIDYKTGRSTNYTGGDLREFRRLQLTLYALAVEQVLLAGRSARPLGLAYWLVSDTGAKPVLPATKKELTWFQEPRLWNQVRDQLQHWVATLADHIRRGVFALRPRSEHCTQTCSFSQVCRISQARSVEKKWSLPLPIQPDSATAGGEE